MTRLAATLAALLACSVAAGAQQGRDESSFVWSKQMQPGSTITVRNGDGFIHVGESTSDRVEVRAVKVTRVRGAVRDVAFDVDETRGGVTVCTLYDRQTSCRDRNRSSRGPIVRVEYTVLVPRDIRVDVATGNGEVVVEHAGVGVAAATGNGRVFVTTARGPVSVSTGNGDVDVRVQSMPRDAGVDVTTGSGSIRVALPPEFTGYVDTQSGNGMLRSDFDITIFGRLDAHHIRGTIGRSGPAIRLHTGNGHIELRKS